AGDEARREEFREDRVVQRGADAARGQERFDLRREQQLVLGRGVVERFDPEPIPREKEATLPPVPQGEREHPPEALDAPLPFFLVDAQDRLGVAPRLVAVATGFETGPERGVVVDLAVVDDPDALEIGRASCRARWMAYDG